MRRSITECCVADHKDDPAILGAWLGNKTPQTVASWFESPTNYSLVALKDGAVIGVSLLTGAGKLALCYLLPEARGLGAGKAMLAKVEETACNWGVKAVQLHSTATGEEFFASQGYVRSGHVRSPYGVDTIFFWKQLDRGAAPDTSQRKRFCNCNSA
ncbi:GNAT family N-acetyltransferase [Pseudoduganella aquatica]|uniref:GNAT family N-acetyltransferase n=1 Tax=Pseudoduganella aquatica TaxID=2660641 RepID=UPI001E596C83|nr:GNAT family N-acetyltransferase [Pseudoduganella aquatica]